MAQVDAVIGNSSSGLYEAPSLRVPTLDIGDRQRGRLAADSVVRCAPNREAIRSGIDRVLSLDCSRTVNPYGDGQSAARIVNVLRQVLDPAALLKKRFILQRQY
jgi:UDP-N-acetylglucosamine 2-epimerase (non-hydrolysing)/GDP/UDP-N,N'-diacetylbacillosamine 2-epimerase (hydrolysing)